MFRWRQQRIHREFGQEHWQPGTRRAWSANEEITSSHPIPVTGQSLARKRGDKMVLGSMMSDNLCSSFSTPGCSYITFQERQKLQIFCPLWKGCLNVTLEFMCVLLRSSGPISLYVPLFSLVQPRHSAWVTSSDKLLAPSRGQCLERRVHWLIVWKMRNYREECGAICEKRER